MTTTTYKVGGMTCGGCAKSVETAITSLASGAKVSADAKTGLVQVDGASPDQVSKAVDQAGFEFQGAI